VGFVNLNANLWHLFFATFAVLPFTNFITSAAPRLAVGLNTPAAFVVVDEKLLDRP
jgi:hypothetical protein